MVSTPDKNERSNELREWLFREKPDMGLALGRLLGTIEELENELAQPSAIEPIKPWWVPPIRYDKDRGYFLDANGTLVATARVSIADHMQEQIAAAINASTDGGAA